MATPLPLSFGPVSGRGASGLQPRERLVDGETLGGDVMFVVKALSGHPGGRSGHEAGKHALGRMTPSFGIFRGSVGHPEGALTNQPGARSAAPGGSGNCFLSPERATQTDGWIVSPFQGLFAAMIRYPGRRRSS